ncbi:MAG: hypothetical protein WD768_00175 [Phycisphaeraceae bacterium]
MRLTILCIILSALSACGTISSGGCVLWSQYQPDLERANADIQRLAVGAEPLHYSTLDEAMAARDRIQAKMDRERQSIREADARDREERDRRRMEEDRQREKFERLVEKAIEYRALAPYYTPNRR